MHQVTGSLWSYWKTWLVLFFLTLAMVFLDQGPFPAGLLIAVLVFAMLAKASLIGAYFMHLRQERLFLVYTVVIGILILSAILFVLIVPDAVRALRMDQWGGQFR